MRGCRRFLCGLVVLLLMGPHGASAQPDESGGEMGPYVIAGAERVLWVAQMRGEQARLHSRTVFKPFGLPRLLFRPVTDLAAVGEVAYARFADDSIYRIASDSISPEQSLRDPIDFVATERRLLAIGPTAVLRKLTTRPGGDGTGPGFDPGDRSFGIAAYDGHFWYAVAPLPAEITEEQQPRLLAMGENPLLFWLAGESVECHRLTVATQTWSEVRSLDAPDVRRFWPMVLDSVPVLVCRQESGETGLIAYRLLGNEWRRGTLNLSPMPEGASPVYLDAVPFGPRIALLATVDGRWFIQFARITEDPGEETIDLQKAFAETGPRSLGQLRLLVLAVFAGLLVAVFVFFREAIAVPIPLAPGWQLALVSQRAVAWLIDYLPFTLGASFAMGVSWTQTAQALGEWAFFSELAPERMPAFEALLWWALATGGYVAYALIMELITGRTVGKVLLGLHVLGAPRPSRRESAPTGGEIVPVEPAGRPARFLQVVIRNLSRIVEMVPPYWALLFLVVLTRNRQRLGDIFARTVVARREVRGTKRSSVDENPSAGS